MKLFVLKFRTTTHMTIEAENFEEAAKRAEILKKEANDGHHHGEVTEVFLHWTSEDVETRDAHFRQCKECCPECGGHCGHFSGTYCG